MSPVELRPEPPVNRQPLWLFWTCRYIGFAFTLIGLRLLRLSGWLMARQYPHRRWAYKMTICFLDLGKWIAPKGRHESMMREPPKRKNSE